MCESKRERARYSRMVYWPEVDQSDRTARQKKCEMMTQEVREDNAHTARHDGRCGVEGSQLMGGEGPDQQEPDAVTEMCTDS